MMGTKNNELKAVVPDSLRGDGAMYANSKCQESSHSRELELSRFCKDALKMLEVLIKGIFYSEKHGEWNVSSTALSFKCEFSARERGVMISKLIFCDRGCQYGMGGMLLGTLINLCTHWNSDEHLSLIVRNPIPHVRKCLENMSWCSWTVLEDDLVISWDNIASVEKNIPLSIKRTKCCLNRSEFVNRTEQWGVQLPTVEPQNATSASCISMNYISSLECLLYRFDSVHRIDFMHGICLRTDALCVNLLYTMSTNVLELKSIEVRPCLQGRGIGTMAFWRLMYTCVQFQISTLKISRAYPSSVSLMTKLGGFKKVGAYEKFDDYTITLNEMCKKTLQSCGLDKKMKENDRYPGYYEINTSCFPVAELLNC